MSKISDAEMVASNETERKRSSLVSRIKGEIGAHNLVIYEIYEDTSKFADFAGATTVKIQYKRKNLKRIKKELTRTCVDMVYTDVRDEEWMQFLLDMGVTLCLTKEGLDGSAVTTYSSQWDAEVWNTIGVAVFDKLFALLGCAACLFVLLVYGVIVKLMLKWDVIIRQDRIGLNGRRFTLYQLRTEAPSKDVKPEEKSENDDETDSGFQNRREPKDEEKEEPSIWMRILKIFPQFWNVLKGDMSIVGAYPPNLTEWWDYEPKQHQVLTRKPGMTGMWIHENRPNEQTAAEIFTSDMQYIKNRTVKNYFSAIAKTIKPNRKADDQDKD